MKAKNWLFILPNLREAGAERVTVNFVNALERRGDYVTLCLLRLEGGFLNHLNSKIEIKGIRSSSFDRIGTIDSLKRSLGIFCSLYRRVRNADVIVAALELTPSYIAVILSIFFRKPVVLWVHIGFQELSVSINPLHCWISKIIYRLPFKTVFVSNGAMNSMRNFLSLKSIPENWTTIPNIVEINEENSLYSPRPDELPKGEYALAVGRLHRQKGFDILLHSWAKLVIDPEFKFNLVIVGDGVEHGNLLTLSEQLGIQKRVFFVGRKANPTGFYRHASLFILSSRWEGLPTVLIEALHSGLPIVSTDCPHGARDILCNGKFGCLVPVESPGELANAIRRVLSDTQLSSSFLPDREDYLNLYKSSSVVNKWEDFIWNEI